MASARVHKDNANHTSTVHDPNAPRRAWRSGEVFKLLNDYLRPMLDPKSPIVENVEVQTNPLPAGRRDARRENVTGDQLWFGGGSITAHRSEIHASGFPIEGVREMPGR